MKAVKITFLFLIIYFFTGCAQKVPIHDSGHGLVAIPYNFINTSGFPSLQTYEFRSSTDAQFSIKIQLNMNHKDVSISHPIKEGTYTIDAIIIKSVPQSNVISQSNEFVHKIEVPFDISVYDGKIVLIPFVFEVEQYMRDREIYSIFRTVRFDDELEQFYSDRLNNKENIEQWTILVL